MLVKIKNNIEEISRICDIVRNFCVQNGVSDEKYHDVVLILDELITNIISYAYPDGGERFFDLSLEKNDQYIVMNVIDDGIPFDPSSQADPDVDSSIEERQLGGLGIFMVKQLSEVIEYSRVDDQNRLCVKVALCNKNKEENHGD
ncbi:MAG: ATP-binding protein [Holosporaceae bacterium]|jgi:serine/threonine-protein kinase RsbW/sigma-B regulation protein RsbU (phosphoserine phosphatase)|nr:ATP-binding protein [Holosporaceae bacterium]